MANYRRIWEQDTGLKIPVGWHIHHIDGNRNNNNPKNLNCVSPTMHWWAHYLRGDPVKLHGKWFQGAAEAGQRGGRWSVESGQLASIRTPENQAKGRRNRDPIEHREQGRKLGREAVESGRIFRVKGPNWTSQTGAVAGRLGGATNRGKIWITNCKTKQDRKVIKQEAKKLIATGQWQRGRSRGGFNTWDIETARKVHSAGGKAAMAKRWGIK